MLRRAALTLLTLGVVVACGARGEPATAPAVQVPVAPVVAASAPPLPPADPTPFRAAPEVEAEARSMTADECQSLVLHLAVPLIDPSLGAIDPATVALLHRLLERTREICERTRSEEQIACILRATTEEEVDACER